MRLRRLVAALSLSAVALEAAAISLDFENLGVTGVLNTTTTLGVQVRMESRADNLIGKGNLNPDVCRGKYQSCQSLFLAQTYPSQHLAAAPGAPTMRADDGDLNYDKYDLTQGGLRITQDLTFNRDDLGFFARWILLYDAVNANQGEYHPNIITAENVGVTGITGDPVSNRYFDRVYGAGQALSIDRNSGVHRNVSYGLQVLDANFFGKVDIPNTDKTLTFKLGRQTVNWGESTVLVINSVNQAQPVNTNNLYRLGFQLEEVFTPVGMAFASFEPFDGSTMEAFYQFEWKPVEIPAPGSFMSFADIGSKGVGNYVNLSFGSSADDPDRVGRFLDNPLALITPTTAKVTRVGDRNPSSFNQYGVALKTYFEELNGGTEISLYAMNYHSRLPYISFISANASCARREGNALGLDARNTQEFLRTCPNIPALAITSARTQLQQDAINLILNRPQVIGDLGLDAGITDPLGALTALQPLLLGGDPSQPYSDAVGLDTGPFFLEYPQNIHMFGVSFNTTAGDYSFQGEVAYRPNLPLQVSVIDLAFGAAGPLLTRCHDHNLGGTGCAGSSAGDGFTEDGGRMFYGSSDADPNNPDTINLLVGHVPGSARSFPSFVIPYRGGQLGENAPNSYIRGYERMGVFQPNLGITRVYGATDNYIGADQIIVLGEMGATWVPSLPALDRLQIDGPGQYYHASAGADGSGSDGSLQACSSNADCVVGADGLRFNPHQADLRWYATKFSWGYRIVSQIKYESVLPGISIQPTIIWAHDVNGVAPGPGENFVRGRKNINAVIETRYKSDLSFGLGYSGFFGAGEHNLYRDRDNAQAFVRYLF